MFGTERVPPALHGGQHGMASRTAQDSRDRIGLDDAASSAMRWVSTEETLPCGVLARRYCVLYMVYMAEGCSDGLDASTPSRVTHFSNRAGPWLLIGDAVISGSPPFPSNPLLSRFWVGCRRGAWRNMCHACWASFAVYTPSHEKVPIAAQGPSQYVETRVCQRGSASSL